MKEETPSKLKPRSPRKARNFAIESRWKVANDWAWSRKWARYSAYETEAQRDQALKQLGKSRGSYFEFRKEEKPT